MKPRELLKLLVARLILHGDRALTAERIGYYAELPTHEAEALLLRLTEDGTVDAYRPRVAVGIKEWDLGEPEYTPTLQGVAECLT